MSTSPPRTAGSSNASADANACAARTRRVLVALAALVLLAAVARLLVGESFGWPPPRIRELRVLRLAIGLTVGAALAVSGAVLQALLRNPLASPYILGLSSGATLGYLLAGFFSVAGWSAIAQFGADQTSAFVGALAVMLVVYALAQRRGWIDPIAVLLIGVVVNALNGAAIMFVSYVAPTNTRGQMMLWMLGYFSDFATPTTIGCVAALSALGIGVSVALGRAMDVAVFSTSESWSLGLDVRRLRIVLFVIAGLLTAGSVLLAGPIGFVGLVCPHIVRLLIGPRHRPLIIGSALAGAALIVAADTAIKAASTYLFPGASLVPIGVLTAFIGGPVFLFFLWPQVSGRREP